MTLWLTARTVFTSTLTAKRLWMKSCTKQRFQESSCEKCCINLVTMQVLCLEILLWATNNDICARSRHSFTHDRPERCHACLGNHNSGAIVWRYCAVVVDARLPAFKQHHQHGLIIEACSSQSLFVALCVTALSWCRASSKHRLACGSPTESGRAVE